MYKNIIFDLGGVMVDFALVRQIELIFGNRDMRYFAHSFHKEYQGQ